MNRPLVLGLGIGIAFVATALILSAILPGPHKPTDYLVIGGVSTVVCLAILFFVLIVAPGKAAKTGKPRGRSD